MQNFSSFIVKNSEAILLDRMAVEKNKIEPIILMEEAAERLFCQLKSDFLLNKERIAIVVGWGNNAGDALSLARKLLFTGIDFDIYFFSDKEGSDLYKIQFNILRTLKINFFDITKLKDNISNYTLIIDGIFGVGYKYRKDENIEALFDIINASNAIIVSIDVPSGLTVENNKSIKANYTYSVGFLKELFFTPSTRRNVGFIRNIPISFVINNINYKKNVYYFTELSPLERKKDNFVHKYKRGGVLCIGGSFGKLGSIVLSSEAAIYSGAGITLVLSEKDNIFALNSLSKIVIFDELANYKKYIDKYDTILIGPGLDITEQSRDIIFEILKLDKQFILDASFFTLFDFSLLKFFKRSPILTPHTNELKTFFKRDDFLTNTIESVSNIALTNNCHILFKDAFMLYCTPDGNSYVIDKPNRIVAQAGSGDILAGIIAGTVAQGYKIEDSIFEAVRIFYSIADDFSANSQVAYSSDEFIALIPRKVYPRG